MIDDAERQIILPVVDTLARDEGGAAFDRAGLPDDERLLLVEAGGREVGVPIEAGGFCSEVGARPQVVAFLDVAAVAPAGVALGDLRFERHNAGCLRLRVRDSR